MDLIVWLENTAFADVIRVSAYGYPAMITLHSLGLAVMLGLSVVLSLRIIGFFRIIPLLSLHRLLWIAWAGFIVNFLSGMALFSISATTLIRDPVFGLKMLMVVIGAGLVAIMQRTIRTEVDSGGVIASQPLTTLKILAWLSIVAWTIGMIAGRLIAYLPP